MAINAQINEKFAALHDLTRESKVKSTIDARVKASIEEKKECQNRLAAKAVELAEAEAKTLQVDIENLSEKLKMPVFGKSGID
jgi:hypothetical protein